MKDLINIRRTDGEMLRKVQPDGSQSSDSRDNGDSDSEWTLIVTREKCVPVVKGLMALLLSMDFTCHVDLFIVACKVRWERGLFWGTCPS